MITHFAWTAAKRSFIWLVCVLGPGLAAASSVVPESAEQLAAAPRIVVADLQSALSRWNPQHTLIVTDYRFRTVETLRGDFAAEFTLTQGGGTVDDETHQLSDLPVFRGGGRYLLLLNTQDNPVFSSVRYGPAGAIEVDRSTGQLSAATSAPVSVTDFRRLVERTAVIDDAQLLPAQTTQQSLPASEYRRDETPRPGARDKPLSGAVPAIPAESVIDARAQPQNYAAIEPQSVFAPSYTVQRRPAPTITFNPFPHAWVWHPYDQHMMAAWNQYGDIFRVLTTPTGTWAWSNDRYDLAGFPSNADMVAQFGAGWGATTLAICYSRWFGSGPIVESDIAINPAYGWTLDDAYGTDTAAGTPWSFRQTILHELGHSWGLQHPFEFSNVFWPSVMNYGPKWARDPVLHSDDTAGIRWAYPGLALHDGSLQLYRTSDGGDNNAAYTRNFTVFASYTHGQSLSFNGAATVQNSGTTNLVNPDVDVYLTERRMDWTGAVYIGRSSYSTTIAPFPASIGLLNLGSFFVSSNVPTGVYFPALYLAGSGGSDQNLGNNSSWAVVGDTTTIRNVTEVLVPTVAAQYSSLGRIGPLGEWTLRFSAQADKNYLLSTCGLASFDTTLRLTAGATTLYSDDACGLQSQIRWRSPIDQTVNLVVRGFSQADQGTFRLLYQLDPEAVFSSGFGG